MTPSIPVLDVAGFTRDPTSSAGQDFVEDLGGALHEIGFVYLTGHGVEPALEQRLLEVSRRFFALPEAERRRIAIEHSAAFRGYTILGDERTNGASDWRDQLDVGPEQLAPDDPAVLPAWHRLRGPNQWPESLPEMAAIVLEWLAAVERLGLTTLRAVALALGQPIDAFDDGFVPRSDVHAKIIRYPSQESPARSPGGQGVGLHHDSGISTFILQDGTGGLQVQVGDDFVDADPIEGTYVMNLGEMMQSATGGYLRATPHRVLSPSDGSERLSAALFFNPRFETRFPAIELPQAMRSSPSRPGGSDADPIHELFGENNLKIRLRSHPDVAARHYADVLAGESSWPRR